MPATMMDENGISRVVVDCAFKVHVALGPGLFESVYERALEYEIAQCGLNVRSQVPLPVRYGPLTFEEGFRADLLVDDRVIVELKSVEHLADIHKKQLLTYLKVANLRLGLLVNFGATRIKDGIVRVVNGLPE